MFKTADQSVYKFSKKKKKKDKNPNPQHDHDSNTHAFSENRVHPCLENPLRSWKSSVFISQEEQELSSRKSKINKNQADSLAFGVGLLMCKLSTYINENFQV